MSRPTKWSKSADYCGGIGMETKFFDVDVTYSQLAIFWAALPQPFNDWTDMHVSQGFAWRQGSVSFKTLDEQGVHSVSCALINKAAPVSKDAIRVIQVPFEVPDDGMLEVASISDSVSIELPNGMYQLRCELILPKNGARPCVNLFFLKTSYPSFSVVKADNDLSVKLPLLISAEPAKQA